MSRTTPDADLIDADPALVAPAALTVDAAHEEAKARRRVGPVAASAAFRAAVPDLTCALEDLLIAGDKAAARLRFRGHFTGVFNRVAGNGQTIDFLAIDIQHVGPHGIVEDWHLEDNLTFLQQADLVRIAGS